MLDWWQNLPRAIDPVAVNVGPLPLRWYGLGWVAAYLTCLLVTLARVRRGEGGGTYTREQVADFLIWCLLGALLGGRAGYLLFYGWEALLADPLGALLPFGLSTGGQVLGLSGLSFQGGALGVLAAFVVFSRRRKWALFPFVDLLLPGLVLGYFFGRVGNFMNGELWGRVTEAAIGMHFPGAPDGGAALRHPSQLYEAVVEGLLPGVALWWWRGKTPFAGWRAGAYIVWYAVARFGVEFFREPDAHLGYRALGLTQGQLLCAAMVVAGAGLLLAARAADRRRRGAAAAWGGAIDALARAMGPPSSPGAAEKTP
ncbi:MAG: prolipoprotein diacylglyceryl transferase [Planctomycetes bacterium]|nr:prolipoprotein diacylglyceryl transferase [Planctomycetota bacterium]